MQVLSWSVANRSKIHWNLASDAKPVTSCRRHGSLAVPASSLVLQFPSSSISHVFLFLRFNRLHALSRKKKEVKLYQTWRCGRDCAVQPLSFRVGVKTIRWYCSRSVLGFLCEAKMCRSGPIIKAGMNRRRLEEMKRKREREKTAHYLSCYRISHAAQEHRTHMRVAQS